MLRTCLAALAAFGLAAPAVAALDVPIPANAYITMGGLDWAWAIPLPGTSYPNALDYQGTQGWRLPTAAELAMAPLATDFLFAGGNVPFGGIDPVSGARFLVTNADYTTAASAGACAAPYFQSGFVHCDWQDGLGQPLGPWAGMPGSFTFSDQLYVRDASGVIPEPGTWALLIAGFGMVGLALRQRKPAHA